MPPPKKKDIASQQQQAYWNLAPHTTIDVGKIAKAACVPPPREGEEPSWEYKWLTLNVRSVTKVCLCVLCFCVMFVFCPTGSGHQPPQPADGNQA